MSKAISGVLSEFPMPWLDALKSSENSLNLPLKSMIKEENTTTFIDISGGD